MSSLVAIYYGNSQTDLNLCSLNSQAYSVKGDAPDLSSNTATFTLTNSAPEIFRDLTVNMLLLENNIVNFNYNYADSTGIKDPF